MKSKSSVGRAGEEGRAERAARRWCRRAPSARAPKRSLSIEDVLDLLGGDRHDAADGARTVDVGDRAARHLDLRRTAPGRSRTCPGRHARETWKFWRAPSTMTATRPKSCRPRMLMLVPGSSALVLRPHAGHAGEAPRRSGSAGSAPRSRLDMIAHAGHRVDRLLAGLGGEHRDRVEIEHILRLARSAPSASRRSPPARIAEAFARSQSFQTPD